MTQAAREERTGPGEALSLGHLTVNPLDERRFMSIPPGAIVPGSLPKFRIYVHSPEGQYVLWAEEGNRVSPDQLAKLSDFGLEEVFVDLDEEFKYEEYLESHLGHILEHEGPSDEQKAEIFSKVSTNVVKHAFATCFGMGTLSAQALQRTRASSYPPMDASSPAEERCLPSAVRRPRSNGVCFSRTSRFTAFSFPRRHTVVSACISGIPSPKERRVSMNPSWIRWATIPRTPRSS